MVVPLVLFSFRNALSFLSTSHWLFESSLWVNTTVMHGLLFAQYAAIPWSTVISMLTNSMIDRFSRTPDFLILRYASLRRMSTVETPPPGDATVHVFLF